MSTTNQNRTLGLGILIILTGLVFLLDQLNFFSYQVSDVLISWQMLLIVIGVYNLFFTQSRTFGYIVLVVGVFFIIPKLFYVPYDFNRSFWPVLLILLGVFILIRSRIPSKSGTGFKLEEGEAHETFDEVNIFSGSEKQINIESLKGGKVTSIFGGSDIDLTTSKLAGDHAVIEVFYMFGGSTIRVPADWIIVNNVTAIFGGFTDKRANRPSGDDNKKLILNGFVMFGGGEIKS
ncbi:MAG: cell wall-active antibiotics response protein [Bacteroidetes bacterium]|nr:cell wall-active antibiotics response protein [Bacteroidota bacterium]